VHEKEFDDMSQCRGETRVKKEETLKHIFWTTLQYLSNRHLLVKRFFNETIVKPQLYTDTNKIQEKEFRRYVTM